jgi:hypothetical protein
MCRLASAFLSARWLPNRKRQICALKVRICGIPITSLSGSGQFCPSQARHAAAIALLGPSALGRYVHQRTRLAWVPQRHKDLAALVSQILNFASVVRFCCGIRS